ncbi:tyrosine-type recombinase/integrase [Microbacterium sp. K41]|uniref:tyrosine-type recombinase/integrase n=1 Tax=Microbacterium sp. K41 TaxID=2305437 RepID=UPI00109C11BC|nr:tyrosine-type recombinase/integrase [Microbacterium sp. K41]
MSKRRGQGTGTIFRDQRGYWTVVLPLPSVDGKRRRKSYRSKKREVVLAHLRAFEQARGGTDLPSLESYPSDSGTTVGEWFEYWLAECVYPHLRPKTADGYRSIAKTRIIPALGAGTPLAAVRAADVRRMHRWMRDECSPTTVRNAHVVAARAFDVAVREEEIERNPVRLVEQPRPARPKLDVPTTQELRYLLEALKTRPDGLKWMTYILTGARRGEVVGLEVGRVGAHLDISWQMQTLRRGENGLPIAPPDFDYRHLYGGFFLTRPKSRAGWRTVPLINPLRGMMEHHLSTMETNPWGLVFTRKGRPIDPNMETRLWRTIQRELLGEDRRVRLHDLRHAAVDLLYAADVPEELIVELVGHSTRATTRSYKSPAHLDRLSRAMIGVEDLLA